MLSSSFGNKREEIEIVVPMMEKDDEWRVSGYYIKKLSITFGLSVSPQRQESNISVH